MADDEPGDESMPDPWADILAGGDPEVTPEQPLSLEEFTDPQAAAESAAALWVSDTSAADFAVDVPQQPAVAPQVEEDLVSTWLDDAEPVTAAEATATTGPVMPDAAEADIAATDGDEGAVFAPLEGGEDAAAAAFAGAAVGAVVSPAGTSPRKGGRSKQVKKGGIGQAIGVVLGGVMAIPITLAILIWGLQKDPFKVTKYVPESAAFLLPQKFQPGFKKPAAVPGPPKGSPLDALATGGGDAGVVSPPAAEPIADAVATVPMPEPAGADPGEVPIDDSAVVPPADGETFDDPLAAPAAVAVKPVEPSALDAKLVAAEAARLAAEAALADRKPVDAAVEEAVAAVAALEEVADVEDPSRKTLLIGLYKAAAKVGEELVILERVSADAGRPLAEPPPSIVELHGRLGRHRDDLVRLSRNWLDWPKRPSDGVVLPVTFQAARKIGPYWSSKVTLEMPKGGVRELAVISRVEPAAVQGDAVTLTGVVFDGDVIWAADVRPTASEVGAFGSPTAAGEGFGSGF